MEPSRKTSISLLTELKGDVVNDLFGKDLTLTFQNPDPFEQEFVFKHLNYKDIEHRWGRWAQEAIVSYFGGWNDPYKQTLVQKRSTASSVCMGYCSIAMFASKYHPNKTLSEWNHGTLKEFINALFNLKLVFSVNQTLHMKRSYPSYVIIERTLACLRATFGGVLNQQLPDGIMFQIGPTKKVVRQTLKQEFKHRDIAFEEWADGANTQPLDPLLVAMMSAYAISIIDSPKTSFLLEMYKINREFDGPPIFSDQKIFRRLEFAFAYSKTASVSDLRTKSGRKHRAKDILCKEIYLQLINKYRKQLPPKKDTGFPFNSFHELHEIATEIYDSCYWLLLTCTGIRRSELLSLTGDSYDEEKQQFRSKIKKNNNSSGHDRGGSRLIERIFELLNNISLIPKQARIDGESISLWARVFNHPSDSSINTLHSKESRQGRALPVIRKTGKVMHMGDSLKGLDSSLKRFCQRFSEQQPEVAELTSNIHAHRLRHSYAQFIMRRFEGYIDESLRLHFRHSAGSGMTSVYQRKKLKAEESLAMEREYINEIVERIYHAYNGRLSIHGNEMFYGKIAQKIKSLISKIESVKPDELISALSLIGEKIESINAHNYGYCLIMKETRDHSRCFDKKTDTPNVKSAHFDICSGCNHFMYSQNNELEVANHQFLHAQQIKVFQKLGVSEDSLMYKASKKSIENAQKILDVLGYPDDR